MPPWSPPRRYGAVKTSRRLAWRHRWPGAVRDDVLARLLALNSERYAKEQAQGLHSEGGEEWSGLATSRQQTVGGVRPNWPRTARLLRSKPIRWGLAYENLTPLRLTRLTSAMPSTARASRKPPADIEKTAARRFPLVHKLIHYADLRNFYREMRDALITANRRAGAQQGLVTKAKKKITKLEEDIARLEKERDDLLAYRQRAEDEADQIASVLPRLKARLLQVQQIEQALENLADIKEAVDQHDRANGGPSSQSIEDLKRAVERLLERADAVEFFEESIEDIESDRNQSEQANDDDHA